MFSFDDNSFALNDTKSIGYGLPKFSAMFNETRKSGLIQYLLRVPST